MCKFLSRHIILRLTIKDIGHLCSVRKLKVLDKIKKMQSDGKRKTAASVAVFQISESINIDVKKGEFSKPFLLLQERGWDGDANMYACKSILLTVCQWTSLKNNFKNIQEFVTCVKSGGHEMSMDLGDRKLLKVTVKSMAGGVAVLLQRARSKPDSSGSTTNTATMSLDDLEKLNKWTHVIDSCIKDHSDVPIVEAITDPSQYKSPGFVKPTGLPPKLRPKKLKIPEAFKDVGTQTTFDISTQTMPPTPSSIRDDPFKTFTPTYTSNADRSTPSDFGDFLSAVDINDYTPFSTPDELPSSSCVDGYNPFSYYSPISP